MAYDFLNTTTYTNQLKDQEELLSTLSSLSQSSPLGSGLSDTPFDSDLIEIVQQQNDTPVNSDLMEQPTPQQDEPEPEIDDRVDMNMLNDLFAEQPEQPAPVTRTVYVQQAPEDNSEDNNHSYNSDGKVQPRIWQYGGQPTKYKFGGENTLYADTYEQQRIGLNNPNYNTAVFSTKGTNTFRGLDNHQPVAVTDGQKYKVLHGPDDIAKFNGPVYEQKLPKMQTGGATSQVNPRYVFDPNDPAIKNYSDSLSKYNRDKRIYENETHLDYNDLLEAMPGTNVTYTQSGKAIYLNRKPKQPVIYKDIKPSNVQEIAPYTSDANVEGHGYSPVNTHQDVTNYSASFRDETQDSKQNTIYFKNRDAWRSFLNNNALSNVDTSETSDSAHATGYRRMQIGGELKPETKEIKDFYSNYANSPNYTKRLSEQGYSNPNQAILDRIANLNTVTTSVDKTMESQYDAPNYTAVYNPNQAKELGVPMMSALAHEYGHTVGASQQGYLKNPLLELNPNEFNAFNSRNKLNRMDMSKLSQDERDVLEHDAKPAESKADLDALRFRLYKDKVYDTGTQDFTPEHLNQAKERYKDDGAINRLFQNYSDDDLIYLMNKVAKNNTNNRPIYG